MDDRRGYWWWVCGGNPDGNGGGVIEGSRDRFDADRRAARAVARGYRNVRVVSDDEMFGAREVTS